MPRHGQATDVTPAKRRDHHGRQRPLGRARGLPVAEGHRAGTRALRRTVEAAIDLGVESLAVYAFSTENWTRPADEVEDADGDLRRDDRARAARPRRAGRPHALHRPARPRPDELASRWRRSRRDAPRTTRLQLWIAFDYGGRAELVEAARRLVEDGVPADDVDEDALAAQLYAPELPDPDLLIRTSGELRLSNFLLWQLAYSELVFVDTLWPDFGEDDLRAALDEYASRRARFGGR